MSAAATTERAAISVSSSLPTFFDNLDSFAEAPEGVAKLRELILQTAIRGSLVPQNPDDEPASELLERMDTVRAQLVKEKKLKKSKPLAPVGNGELPYQLPDGWAATRIGEVACISTGYAFKSPDYTPTGTFVLRVTNIKPDGTIVPDDAVFMPMEKITPRIESYYLEAGDILVVMVGGSLGKIGVVTDDLLPALLNQNMWRLRPISDDYDIEFLRLTLEYINRFQLNITASTHGHMSMTEYKTQPIGVPPLSEQRQIVSKVDDLMSLCDELESRGSERVRLRERASRSCLERLVSSRSRRDLSSAWQRLSDHFEVLYDTPETLAHLRQSILQLAVQGKLVPQDPNDEPASDSLTKLSEAKAKVLETGRKKTANESVAIYENEIPFELPSSWAWARVGDVLSLKHGYAFKSSTFTDKPTPFVLTTPGNFYETGGFRDRGSKTRFVDGPVEPEFIFKTGDLMIPMTEQAPGLLGSPAFIPDDGRTYVHNQRLGKLEVFAPVISREFLFLFFNSPFLRSELAKTCSGTTVRHTSPNKVLRVLFPVCPLAEQKRIVAKVDQLLSQCDELSARLRERQSATQQLLTATIHRVLLH